jgi:hypothetical protein
MPAAASERQDGGSLDSNLLLNPLAMCEPTPADGILGGLVHNARRIAMRGDSMRKNRGKPNASAFFWWATQTGRSGAMI